MGFFSNLLGSKTPQPTPAEEPLVPVPVPALGMLLLQLEKEKGFALTEAEVLSARGKAVCMMMRLSHKEALDEKRGYRDVDPLNVWVEWQAFRMEAGGREA
jgi:hypothetical protein